MSQAVGDSIPDDAPVYVISVAAGWRDCTRRRCGSTTGSTSCVLLGRRQVQAVLDARCAAVAAGHRVGRRGMNLIGIKRVLELETRLADVEARLARYEQHDTSTALVVWRPPARRR